MTDPVTNAEVEDVLSSIRRLVSEDKRPFQTNKAPETDRLVLTPALRVSDGKDVQPSAPSHESVAAGFASGHGTPDREPEGQAAQAERVEGATVSTGELAKDQEDPGQDYTSDPYGFDNDADEHDDIDAARFVAPQPHAKNEDDLNDMLVLNNVAAVVPNEEVDAVQQVQEVVPAESPEESDAQDHLNQEIRVASELEDGDEAEQGSLSATSKAAALSAKIEELESAIGSIVGAWEPSEEDEEAPMASDVSQDALSWEDDVPEDVKPTRLYEIGPDVDVEEPTDTMFHDVHDDADEPVDRTASSEADNGFQASTVFSGAGSAESTSGSLAEDDFPDYTADTQIIDEEMLRDMVSEIVRAELQGALGERITRNVRKLVRREIHRALTTQDLE